MNPNQGTQTEAMYAAAMEFAAEKASISYVQRKCRCSYNDAERMLERMVIEGIIETYGGRKTVATTPAQPAAPQGVAYAELPDERAAFEAWIKKDCGDLSTFGSGQNIHYSNTAVNNAWTGWKARASNGQAPAGATPDSDAMDEARSNVFDSVIEDLQERVERTNYPGNEIYILALREAIAAIRAAQPSTTAQAKPDGDEKKALAALRYYKTECSGAEPSISVFHRMVDDALEAAPADDEEFQRFTTGDSELNDLLNETFAMARGPSTHDTVMLWLEALEAVKARLAPAAGAVAGPVETIKFSDGSTADPVEKARRYLNAMADHRINSQYFFDDGWPKKESAIDAMATLAVLEQLAAAVPTPAAQADSVLEDAARWQELREQHEDDTAERCCVFAPNDMRECLVPVGSLPGELDAFIDAERAARKQGGA